MITMKSTRLAKEHQPKLMCRWFFSLLFGLWIGRKFPDIADSVGAYIYWFEYGPLAGLVPAAVFKFRSDCWCNDHHQLTKQLEDTCAVWFWQIPIPRLRKKLNSACSRFQGWTVNALSCAAKAVALKEACCLSSKRDQQAVVWKNAAGHGKSLYGRVMMWFKGTDDHYFCAAFIEAGLTGKEVDAWLG